VRKDLVIATIAIVVVAAVTFGLAAVRPPLQPTPSHPYSATPAATRLAGGRVVMHVNGEPITDTEFEAAYRLLPEEMQRQFANEAGKMAFAEQFVRMKLLEQEAHRV
jgi:hypothetical protein